MNSFFILGCVVLGIVFFGKIVMKIFSANETEDSFADLRDESSETDEFESEETEDFDKDFFERCQNGESRQLFLKVSSYQDCTMIQSLLAANSVPTHREHEHFNSIYGSGTANLLTETFAIRLWILSSDYDKAFEIVRDFMSQKLENLKRCGTENKKLKSIAVTFAAIYFAPSPITKSHQLLGITILPKEPA